jgi:GxxExxY protein
VQFEPASNLIIGAAIEVHRQLGPGLLESAYCRCLCKELNDFDLEVRREVEVPLIYKGMDVGAAYRLDFVVDRSIIVEVKSVARVEPIHRAQLLTYLRLTGLRTGLLLNFNVPVMRTGVVRLVR